MIRFHETIRVDNEPQFIFGQLVKLAIDKGIAHYHSDLYHDAIWIRRHWEAIVEAGVFFYGVRETGTSIGLDANYVAAIDSNKLFRCVLPPRL